MKMLRILHLYLGCAFAPMLLFFALSGLWQIFDLHWSENKPNWLSYLSTLHTGRGLKTTGETSLSSPIMEWFAAAMAVSLILTILLGIAMAFKFGHRKTAFCCLAAGLGVPFLVIFFTHWAGSS